MKVVVVGIFGVIALTVSISAQVSPVPVTDAEVRDSTSIRMRSIEFERTKRKANEPDRTDVANFRSFKFAAIKEDFENIQELQSAIVKTYETGTRIDYETIADLALEMKKRATRLRANFFGINEAADENKGSEFAERKSVRDLIIELDGTVSVFVGSPLFTEAHVISAKSTDEAKAGLERLIRLSSELHATGERMKR